MIQPTYTSNEICGAAARSESRQLMHHERLICDNSHPHISRIENRTANNRRKLYNIFPDSPFRMTKRKCVQTITARQSMIPSAPKTGIFCRRMKIAVTADAAAQKMSKARSKLTFCFPDCLSICVITVVLSSVKTSSVSIMVSEVSAVSVILVSAADALRSFLTIPSP